MDHEVVPRPSKTCDWLLNSSPDHFGLHQGKNDIVTMEFEVPKIRIVRPTFSTNMVQRVLRSERQKRCCGRKRQGPITKKYCYNEILVNVLWGREDEAKRRQRNGQTWFFFLLKTALFGHILKESAHSLFGAWSFLLVHIRFTPSERPEDFVKRFFWEIGPWKLDHQVGPWKKTIFMVRLHGPWCKPALSINVTPGITTRTMLLQE